MDRFEAMSIVLAVAEAGSLSAAARRQKAPLATVSRKVSELEAHLRTRLFNRSSRALVPTDAGRSYIAAAKRILADVAEAERAASGEYTASFAKTAAWYCAQREIWKKQLWMREIPIVTRAGRKELH